MEETGCKIICGAPTTLAVKGYVKVEVKHAVLTYILFVQQKWSLIPM